MISIDPKYDLSDTAGRMKRKRKKRAKENRDAQFDGGKVEGRLTAEEADALAAYMSERFLTNKSDVLRSALAQFLVKEGYLQPPPSKVKRAGGGETSANRSVIGGWSKLTRRVAILITAGVAWLSTVSALSHSNQERSPWRIAIANRDLRHEHGGRAVAVDWFFDLEPAYQTAIAVMTSIAIDLTDGKLSLLGGLQLW
jgi:hypothetical protein